MAQAAQGCVAPPSGRPQEASGNRRPRWMTIPARAGQNSAYRPPRWRTFSRSSSCHRSHQGPARFRCRTPPQRSSTKEIAPCDRHPCPPRTRRRFSPRCNALAAPAVAQDEALDRIDLPSGWPPEGITTDGSSSYAGSLGERRHLVADPVAGSGEVLVPARTAPLGRPRCRPRWSALWTAGGPSGEVRAYDSHQRRAAGDVPLRIRLPQRRRGAPRCGLRH